MTSRLEDIAGKIVMVAAFYVAIVVQLTSVIAESRSPASVDILTIVSRLSGLVFLIMVIYLTVTRLPPRESAAGVEPRITAIAGTFILVVLVGLPTGTVGPGLRLFSTILMVIGTVLSIYCLSWLGRSFSIMATARRLVIRGPYRIVRHPLYAAEAVTSAGVVISNWSLTAATIGLLWCLLQYRRMINEERVLRGSFPEYDHYAESVPMFFPALPLAWLAKARA